MTTATAMDERDQETLAVGEDPTALDVLDALLDALRLYGADVSDHRCNPTEHEDAMWAAKGAAQRFARAQA